MWDLNYVTQTFTLIKKLHNLLLKQKRSNYKFHAELLKNFDTNLS